MNRIVTAFFLVVCASSAIASSGTLMTEYEFKACVDLSANLELRDDGLHQQKRALGQEDDRIAGEEDRLMWLEVSKDSAKSTYRQCNPRFSNCEAVRNRANQLVREYNNRVDRQHKAIAELQNKAGRFNRELAVVNEDRHRYNTSCLYKPAPETYIDKYCQGSARSALFCRTLRGG